MGISTEITRIQKAKQDLKTAINAKGGSLTTELIDDYAAAVTALSTGSPPAAVVEKDVNFYDYDGTLVYSYTIAEANALSTLPALPDHSGDDVPLTGQEWNYTLEQVNATTTELDVGATFYPTDEKTHIIVEIIERRLTFQLAYYTQTVSYGVTVNWGDGSPTESFKGSIVAGKSHTYASVGTYDISLSVSSGETMGFGDGSNPFITNIHLYRITSIIFGKRISAINGAAMKGASTLDTVILPKTVTLIGYEAFYGCNFKACIIPTSVTQINNRAFSRNMSCKVLSIPISMALIFYETFQYTSVRRMILKGLTSYPVSSNFAYMEGLIKVVFPAELTGKITTGLFLNCFSLQYFDVPSGTTGVGSSAFQGCERLLKLVLPSSLTSIDAFAFHAIANMEDIYFYSTTPPTLANSNAFQSGSSNLKIHVPADSLAAYQSAANWSTLAAKMLGDL